jgi:multiple sugar transport system substrate-binding protein
MQAASHAARSVHFFHTAPPLMKRRSFLITGMTSALLAACGRTSMIGGSSNRPLEIWWTEGYYPEEADAIELIVNRWKEQSRADVKLSFFNETEIVARAIAAGRGGPHPDILYGYGLSSMALPQLARQGLLADQSRIVDPLEADFLPGVLRSVTYRNQRTNQSSVVGMPISMQFANIHYWEDLLAEAQMGVGIPGDWEAFWSLWSEAQGRLRRRGFADVYGIGLPMSPLANDTTEIFEYFLQAHGANLVDASGKLMIDDLGLHKKVVSALSDYTDQYRDGFVPPEAVDWSDADNNISFLSSLSLMIANPTLSIPGSQMSDELTYVKRLKSTAWPKTLSGRPMNAIPRMNSVVIFADSPRYREAESFISYLVRPANVATLLKGASGRFLPVLKSLWNQPDWAGSDDPHLRVARESLRHTQLPLNVLNPAYSEVMHQMIWGKAIQAVAEKRLPVAQAADDAMKAIGVIFQKWWQ